MILFSKTITLRVPSDIIYRALKDPRLEKLFPEYFVGVKRNWQLIRKVKNLLLKQELKIVQFKSLKNSD